MVLRDGIDADSERKKVLETREHVIWEELDWSGSLNLPVILETSIDDSILPQSGITVWQTVMPQLECLTLASEDMSCPLNRFIPSWLSKQCRTCTRFSGTIL